MKSIVKYSLAAGLFILVLVSIISNCQTLRADVKENEGIEVTYLTGTFNINEDGEIKVIEQEDDASLISYVDEVNHKTYHILIDCGTGNKVARILKSMNVTNLQALIVTNQYANRIGGLKYFGKYGIHVKDIYINNIFQKGPSVNLSKKEKRNKSLKRIADLQKRVCRVKLSKREAGIFYSYKEFVDAVKNIRKPGSSLELPNVLMMKSGKNNSCRVVDIMKPNGHNKYSKNIRFKLFVSKNYWKTGGKLSESRKNNNSSMMVRIIDNHITASGKKANDRFLFGSDVNEESMSDWMKWIKSQTKENLISNEYRICHQDTKSEQGQTQIEKTFIKYYILGTKQGRNGRIKNAEE